MGADKAITDFTGYLAELAHCCSPERKAFIEAQAIACYDLMNYSAEVCDLGSAKMRSLAELVHSTFVELRSAVAAEAALTKATL